MTNGMYSAAAAMLSRLAAQNITANNLANVNTVGFKGDRVAFQNLFEVSVPGVLGNSGRASASLPIGSTIGRSYVDSSPGRLLHTGNSIDIALDDDVYLAVEAPQGRLYTKAGNMRLSAGGTLQTAAGFPVLGLRGTMIIRGEGVEINERGDVTVDGQVVDRLSLVRFTDPRVVQHVGDGLLTGVDVVPAHGAVVHPGFIELSNVDAVRTMVEMISGLRTYEAAQRSLQLQDDSMGKLMEIARVSV